MIEKYITLEPTIDGTVNLIDVAGEIKILDTPAGKILQNIIENNNNYRFAPYGYGEKDEEGNITNFQLLGFSLNLN